MSGLISAEDLAARLSASDLFVLDVRSNANGGGRAAYEAAHIPGARHTDYAADGWRVTVNGAPGVMPAPAALAALIGGLGLKPGHDVVIVPAGVGASDFAAAARVYWTLKAVGHQRLAILDGGMAAWTADPARPCAAGAPPARAPDVYVLADTGLRAEAVDVLAALLTSGAVLVDARSESYFRGREKAGEARAAGHIPGAVNIDYVTAFDPATMRLKPRAALTDLFAPVRGGPVISYCNTGHTAALNWFVLSEVLGRADVRLYDGSMTDWTQDPGRPVAV